MASFLCPVFLAIQQTVIVEYHLKSKVAAYRRFVDKIYAKQQTKTWNSKFVYYLVQVIQVSASFAVTSGLNVVSF